MTTITMMNTSAEDLSVPKREGLKPHSSRAFALSFQHDLVESAIAKALDF
jgi:hypothetical protein